MELRKVEKKQYDAVLAILSNQFSAEEVKDITENLKMYLEEGSTLHAFFDEDTVLGFTVLSQYDDIEGFDSELIMDEFYFNEKLLQEEHKIQIASELKKYKKLLNTKKLEVLITQEIGWFGEKLSEAGFICENIKLEKVLPNKKNLPDVLDLIKDSIPEEKVASDRIIQVLLEQDDQYLTELIDTDEDLQILISEGWNPIMVVFSFEPAEQQIYTLIEESNQLINWDDYELTYII